MDLEPEINPHRADHQQGRRHHTNEKSPCIDRRIIVPGSADMMDAVEHAHERSSAHADGRHMRRANIVDFVRSPGPRDFELVIGGGGLYFPEFSAYTSPAQLTDNGARI